MSMLSTVRPSLLAMAAVIVVPWAVRGQDEKPEYRPQIAEASDEPQKSMAAIKVPAGWTISVFAAEPLLANPVAFGIDEKNRFYVAETFRLHKGVTDNRSHMYWLDEDLAARTVEDRVAMYRKWLKPDQFTAYGTEHDRIRLIEDTNGDGIADKATVFADGFDGPAAGIGSGVLARKGDVYFTCIPDLYKLRDSDGDGKADDRKSLSTGYGVHVSFLGHDSHGLKFGPDGRLYFSIGDRGLNVKTGGKHLEYPDTGVVLRCDPDGSNLEVYAFGLRNPQELAFDEFGNLFTCDNNSDGGDKARLVHVVEGGDSGWHIGWQYINQPNSRGPWNAEKMWHSRNDAQPAYIVPPLANIADGPSGLFYDPGTGLTSAYRRHFFLCDFRGAPTTSGIRTFTVKPDGASFALAGDERFVWGTQATDVDLGNDGALYFIDWVQGWGLTGKGRIYKVSPPDLDKDLAAAQVKALLAEGFDQRPEAELLTLLDHADMRVRQEAQFALASRGKKAVPGLTDVAKGVYPPMARIHAIWALGQIGRKDATVLEPLLGLLHDRDDQIQLQAIRVLGDARVAKAVPIYVSLIKDADAKIEFAAAMALGRLGRRESTGPLLEMLRTNDDHDAYLRHAAVMGLVWSGDVDGLLNASQDRSAAVRMGVLLALRRLETPEVARFLDDPEPRLVLEAARAINDRPINDAQARLAALLDRPNLEEPVLRRALNANFRLGGPENAKALAAFAAKPDVPEALRVETLDLLATWPEPAGRDYVVGLWRPMAGRPTLDASVALRPILESLLANPSSKIQRAAARAAGRLDKAGAGPALLALVANDKSPDEVRLEALRSLERRKDPELADAARSAVTAKNAELRAEGLRVVARTDPATALTALSQLIETGSIAEKQAAFATLGEIDGDQADALIARSLDTLIAGKLPAATALDLLDAAAKREAPAVKDRLQRHEGSLTKEDPLAPYRVAVEGGNADRGRQVFLTKAEVYCLRCHKVEGNGGEVGPDLTGIGKGKDRAYLLEAIVSPSKVIAEGFEGVTVATTDGQVLSGVLKGEDDQVLRLMTAEAKLLTIPKATIEDRTRAGSAMPDDLIKKMSRAELRDLIEFLAGLKTDPGAHGETGR